MTQYAVLIFERVAPEDLPPEVMQARVAAEAAQEVCLGGGRRLPRADFANALRMLAERPPPDDWVEVLPLREGADAFARLSESPPRATKILLEARAA